MSRELPPGRSGTSGSGKYRARVRGPKKPSVLEAGALVVEHADTLILGAVKDIHTSVSGRVFKVVDKVVPPAAVPHKVHDGISGVVYGSIGLGFKGAARALREADRRGLSEVIEHDLEGHPAGRFAIATLNGMIGDRLAADGSSLAIEMGLRANGTDVPCSPEGIAEHHPRPTDAIVVFLHGLMESDEVWNRRSRPRRVDRTSAPSYGSRLAVEEGWSPVYVRVNTGLPITESGVALSSLLARLVEAWPTEVRRIALVGHSMGGLIARAACAVHTEAEGDWKPLVSDIVCLGTPHLGSPVERTIERGVRLANRVPELRPFARILEHRSAGVLDLHDGSPDDVAQVPQARYHLVAATLTRNPRHPAAATVGDLLVPYYSAAGRGRDGELLFPHADVLHVPKADHFDILNHDDVYAHLRGWLAHKTRETA